MHEESFEFTATRKHVFGMLINYYSKVFSSYSAVLFCCRLKASNVDNTSFPANNFIVVNGRKNVNGKRLLLIVIIDN